MKLVLNYLSFLFPNQSETQLIENFGRLEFKTSPLLKMCTEMKKSRYKNFLYLFLENIKTCAELITTVELNNKILNRGNKFRIGLQIFHDSHCVFIPDKTLLALDTKTFSLEYKWFISKQDKVYQNHFDKRIKLLRFTFTHSWAMAAEKCNKYGMSLPHFSDEKSITEFTMYVLNKYSLPTYFLFIGLTRKVCFEF